MKHGVIMVVSLILTLCLMGSVAANDNISTGCDDTSLQIDEEDIQMESVEINDLEDAPSNFNEEIDDIPNCNIYEEHVNDLDELESLNCLNNLNKDSENLNIIDNLNNLDNSEDLNSPNSLNNLNDLLPINFESVEINDINTENMLNNKINSSNEYVTYTNDDLLNLPLIESDLNDDSIMVKLEENCILSSGNAGLNTANLWNEISWVNGLSSKSNVTLIKRPHPTGFISKQTFYNNYPQRDLPLEYALEGVSGDFDDDAFICNNSDENALITVDMVNESTDNILDLNLNEELSSSYQIGVDASFKALDYFKTQGIDIQKDYPYLYVLTSASYVKINNTSTDDAINGISDVLGLEVNKNIFPIHYSLWKDLVFYYLWINSTNPDDMVSYGLIYDVELSELVESSEIRNQGDYIIYNILSPHDDYYPRGGTDHCIGGDSIINSFINEVIIKTTYFTLRNNTSNVTNVNNGSSNIDEVVGNSVAFKGNINNLFYAIGAIVLISLFFSVVHSKRN